MGQLCEPTLSQSAEEEEEEASRAKKTVHLVRVMAEISPSQFSSSDVFENLISLLRHEDSEIGGWSLGVWPHQEALSLMSLSPPLCHSVGDTLQILTHTGGNIDHSIAG